MFVWGVGDHAIIKADALVVKELWARLEGSHEEVVLEALEFKMG